MYVCIGEKGGGGVGVGWVEGALRVRAPDGGAPGGRAASRKEVWACPCAGLVPSGSAVLTVRLQYQFPVLPRVPSLISIVEACRAMGDAVDQGG
jgi:hypothetical protein